MEPTDTLTLSPEHQVVLQMQGITKRFSGVVALSDVNFDVRRGEVHCLLGENGAGKSTLMKIMSGVYTEYEGQMLLDDTPIKLHSPKEAQAHGIGMIHQELNLVPELRVYENVFLGRELHGALGRLNRGAMRRETSALLDRLGVQIDPDKTVRQLRVGSRQLVEIAKALSLKARILVMDEPTSALSEVETQRLFTVILGLRASGVGLIYISHRMEEIFSIADRITVLRDGHTVISLPAAEVTRPELIRYMVGRTISEAFERTGAAQGETVLEVRGLGLNRPGARPLRDVSFTVRRGEVLGLAGLMGAGRTETLETIFGVYPPNHHSGEVFLRGKKIVIRTPADAIAHGIGFVTEDRKGKSLVGGLPVRVNSTLAALGLFSGRLHIIRESSERKAVRAQVESLDIRTPNIETPVSSLSGGNQQKVVLSKFLLTHPEILLLDEPTRGIDVGAKSQIYDLVGALAKQGTAFVIASSEMPELLAVCDRILVLCEGRITAEFVRGEATQEKILDAATQFSEPEPQANGSAG